MMRISHKIPHNASCSSLSAARCASDPSHEVVDKVPPFESVRCRITQHTNVTGQWEHVRIIDGFNSISKSGVFPSKRGRTFHSSMIQFAHDGLLALCRFGRARDTSFVSICSKSCVRGSALRGPCQVR